jgi:hypothetical protein
MTPSVVKMLWNQIWWDTDLTLDLGNTLLLGWRDHCDEPNCGDLLSVHPPDTSAIYICLYVFSYHFVDHFLALHGLGVLISLLNRNG